MTKTWITNIGGGLALTLWLGVIGIPLGLIGYLAVTYSGDMSASMDWSGVLVRSITWAGIIALVAVILGWGPAHLLVDIRRHTWILGLLILPLVLPRYVIYYAWSLLLSPTTALGRRLAEDPQIAQAVGQGLSVGTLALWYWPLAALLMSQALSRLDRGLWDSARLDAGRWQRCRYVTMPLLGPPVLLAWSVCFVLALSEFATFQLSSIRTVGSELAVLYQLTGSEGAVARAALPLLVIAGISAIGLTVAAKRWRSSAQDETDERVPSKRLWIWTIGLWSLSLGCPIVLLLCHVRGVGPFRQFLTLHSDDLLWSFWVAVWAAALACIIATVPEWVGKSGRIGSLLEALIVATLFVVLFMPASVVAVGLLRWVSLVPGLQDLRMSWMMVSLGQAVRFAGVALIVRKLLQTTQRRDLDEMARLDGLTGLAKWRHVDLPCTWPMLVAVFLLIMMFCFTELSATMVLLPPGLPNFAQRLLNQMHYARDEHVITSCLILIGFFGILTAVLLGLIKSVQGIRSVLSMGMCLLVLTGCGKAMPESDVFVKSPDVIGSFGQTGRGPGQFMYPRAIELLDNGDLLVVDKTGRIQTFDQQFDCIGTFNMPQIENGKPTGMSLGPDGRLYVADTHYHRVCVFSLDGELQRQFGQFGTEDGCFIYPTDVAFSPDGRIYVSEYGGNDRISVFDSDFHFLFAFGSEGPQRGQFSRPSAVTIDPKKNILYVADACNHRIALYDLEGHVLNYWGQLGQGPGQLRYPYDLVLTQKGELLVCEYGNNRIQRFSAAGECLGVYGEAGRNLGQLAYPWGVTIDAHQHVYVVDAGNNRIQIWQL